MLSSLSPATDTLLQTYNLPYAAAVTTGDAPRYGTHEGTIRTCDIADFGRVKKLKRPADFREKTH